MRRTMGLLTLGSALIFCAGTANADDTNLAGSIIALDDNTTSADIYLQYHGRMFVKNSDGILDEYRWGGTSCGSRTLVESEVAALQRALNTKNMRVAPRSQPGQGSTVCLVGSTLVEKKNLNLLP